MLLPATRDRKGIPVDDNQVAELILALPAAQLARLEMVAAARGQTLGQLFRVMATEFLASQASGGGQRRGV
jgi:hypothetical protein